MCTNFLLIIKIVLFCYVLWQDMCLFYSFCNWVFWFSEKFHFPEGISVPRTSRAVIWFFFPLAYKIFLTCVMIIWKKGKSLLSKWSKTYPCLISFKSTFSFLFISSTYRKVYYCRDKGEQARVGQRRKRKSGKRALRELPLSGIPLNRKENYYRF